MKNVVVQETSEDHRVEHVNDLFGETRPVTHLRGSVGHGLLVVHPGGPVARSDASLHYVPHWTAQNISFVFGLLGVVSAMSAFFCGVSLFLGRLLVSSRGAMVVSEGHGLLQMQHFALGSHCENSAACRRHEKTPSEGPHRGKHTRRRPNNNGIVGPSLPRPHPTPPGVPVAPSDAERTLLECRLFTTSCRWNFSP